MAVLAFADREIVVDGRLLFLVVALFLLRPSVMASILGRATTTYYYNPRKTIHLMTKDGQSVSFPDFCKSCLPTCWLNPFLFNGHVQTIWSVVRASKPCPIYYKRWTFENEDSTYSGAFSVDFVVKPYKGRGEGLPPRTTYFTESEFDAIGSDDSRPMLVVLHGLSGGSHELYLRETLAPLVSEKGGWEACVITSRGCSGTKITNNVLYNARATWDTRQTVQWLRRTFPNRPLFGCGFSLGANIITNYIGEEGVSCELKAAVVLSNPWNLDLSSAGLMRSWIGRNLYSRAMAKSMKALVERHIEQLLRTPKIDIEAVRKSKYLRDFDRLVQGPTWGYPTAGAYYRDASSCDAVLDARIPILAINAEDDPIASSEAIPRDEFEQNLYGFLCCTSTGGHLGWYELGGGRWYANATAAFLQKFVHDIDQSQIPKITDLTTGGAIVPPKHDPLRPIYHPTRRKLALPASKQERAQERVREQLRVDQVISRRLEIHSRNSNDGFGALLPSKTKN